MSGCTKYQDAAEDAEVERILAMTEDELIASVGGPEAYDHATAEARRIFNRAVAEAERRVGKRYTGPRTQTEEQTVQMNQTTDALAFCPMADAPQDKPIILVSPWGQVAVAKWDGSSWRYGPQPGETWDADYPKAWVPIHACGWVQ